MNLRYIRASTRLRVLTLAEVTKITGAPDDYGVTLDGKLPQI